MSTTLKINDKTLWTIDDSPWAPVFRIVQNVNASGQLIGLELSTTNTGSGTALGLKAEWAVEVVGNAKIGTLKINWGTIITNFIWASASLSFPLTDKNKSSDLTITVTGASVGDVVMLGIPNDSLPNSCYTAFVSATDTVSVRFNNYSTANNVQPPTGTFKVAVIKF